jgi:hypothetical protein
VMSLELAFAAVTGVVAMRAGRVGP